MSEFRMIDPKKDWELIKKHMGIGLTPEEEAYKKELEEDSLARCIEFAIDFGDAASQFLSKHLLRRNPSFEAVRNMPHYRLKVARNNDNTP